MRRFIAGVFAKVGYTVLSTKGYEDMRAAIMDESAREAGTAAAATANPTPADTPMPLEANPLEIPPAPDVETFIRAAPKSPQFKAANTVLATYPPNALLSATSRTLLYSLVRFLRPEHVMEIGTYQAGTAEILASALHANGKGLLITVDPFPVPSEPYVAVWSQALRARVIFFHGNSMAVFMDLEQRKRKGATPLFDLIFVDGQHDFEYASFDLSMSARHIRPGGIIVMDNAELPGVFWAVKEFLRLNPAWREIGSATSQHSPSAPFESMGSSCRDTEFLILRAPSRLTLGRLPISYLGSCADLDQCAGTQLYFEPAKNAGHLHLRTYLRTFYDHRLGTVPGQLFTDANVPVKTGQTECRVVFDFPLAIPRLDGEILRQFEVLAIWRPDGADDTGLQLNRDPEAFCVL